MITKNLTLTAMLMLASAWAGAQESNGYQFTTVASQKVTSVKNQAATGTCWCFATTSFMEAELREWVKENTTYPKCLLSARNT